MSIQSVPSSIAPFLPASIVHTESNPVTINKAFKERPALIETDSTSGKEKFGDDFHDGFQDIFEIPARGVEAILKLADARVSIGQDILINLVTTYLFSPLTAPIGVVWGFCRAVHGAISADLR